MIDSLKQEALSHGDKLQLIPINRLRNLSEEIESFRDNEELNGFQKWIIKNLYQFEAPALGFTANSIILVAIPHPAYAKIELEWQGKEFDLVSLIMSDFDRTEEYLAEFLAAKRYHIKPAHDLPLKRLSARCSLAVYGRNNICYVEGMGSMFSLAAYFTDMPCNGHDEWVEIRTADSCKNCSACINSCPTGAIRKERFLIDNEKCLSFFNESPGEFPGWLPESVHHCVYDCLKCQISCPMNKEYIHDIAGPILFSEEETSLILSERPFDTYPDTLRQKYKVLGLDKWFLAIPRNLKILLDAEKSSGSIS